MLSLTNIPEPIIPPKYQASSVMSSFSLAGLPPGKSSRMLQRRQRIAKGIKVIPKHLAKFPEHMFQSFFHTVEKCQSKGSKTFVLTRLYCEVPSQLLVPVDLRGEMCLCIYINLCNMMSPFPC